VKFLAYSHKRAHVLAIESAKKPETRAAHRESAGDAAVARGDPS
jgi:hypothetical protein